MTAPVTIAKTDRFKVESKTLAEPGCVELKMIGDIDENVKLDIVWDFLVQLGDEAKHIRFDVSEVGRINSVGVKGWLFFLARVQARLSFLFMNISEAFVDQASLIPKMLGKPGTPVESFIAPFFCEKCKTRVAKSLKTSAIDLENFELDTLEYLCDVCRQPLEFDAVPEDYLRFLKHSLKK